MDVARFPVQGDPSIWIVPLLACVLLALAAGVILVLRPRWRFWGLVLLLVGAGLVVPATLLQRAAGAHDASTLAAVERVTGSTNLRLVEGQVPRCTGGFQGSLQAATWTTGRVDRAGLLVGKREGDQCVLSLRSVG